VKRLFGYLAANESSMRRDELRKTLDLLNEGLELNLSPDAIGAIVRDGLLRPWPRWPPTLECVLAAARRSVRRIVAEV
jgi:hypothetical protein